MSHREEGEKEINKYLPCEASSAAELISNVSCVNCIEEKIRMT